MRWNPRPAQLLAVSAGVIQTYWTVSSSNISTGFFVIWSTYQEIVNWPRTSFRKPGFACWNAAISTTAKHEFSTWLYAVARNLTIDHLRKKSPLSLDGLMEDEEHAPLEPADTRTM